MCQWSRVPCAGMTLHVASEFVESMQADPEIGGGRDRIAPEYRVPGGVWHAVASGMAVTLCGTGLGRLYEFLDQPWDLGMGAERCEPCADAAAER